MVGIVIYLLFLFDCSGGFDSSGQGPAPPLESKNEDSPEEKVKEFEKKVVKLIEESCFAADRGEYQKVPELYLSDY